MLGAHPGQRRTQGDGQVIEKTTSYPRFLTHQGQIFRREDDSAQNSQKFTGPYDSAIEPGTIRLSRDDLDLQNTGTITMNRLGPHDCSTRLRLTRRSSTDQSGVRTDSVARKGRQISDRLNEVGLPLSIGPYESRGTGLKSENQFIVGTEVVECEI